MRDEPANLDAEGRPSAGNPGWRSHGADRRLQRNGGRVSVRRSVPRRLDPEVQGRHRCRLVPAKMLLSGPVQGRQIRRPRPRAALAHGLGRKLERRQISRGDFRAEALIGHDGRARTKLRAGTDGYGPAEAVGSPSDSISRLAQLKNAAAWITSAIARSSRPARRRRSTCCGPNVIGVMLSATEAATMAFQRSPRSAFTPSSNSRCTSASRFEYVAENRACTEAQ